MSEDGADHLCLTLLGARNVLLLMAQTVVKGAGTLFGFRTVFVKCNLTFSVSQIRAKIQPWLLQAESRAQTREKPEGNMLQ